MTYTLIGKVLSGADSIFKTTILAARRAVELNNGAHKLIDTNSTRFSTIALEEIIQGKVKYKIKN